MASAAFRATQRERQQGSGRAEDETVQHAVWVSDQVRHIVPTVLTMLAALAMHAALAHPLHTIPH